jgi:hypothetical protein
MGAVVAEAARGAEAQATVQVVERLVVRELATQAEETKEALKGMGQAAVEEAVVVEEGQTVKEVREGRKHRPQA